MKYLVTVILCILVLAVGAVGVTSNDPVSPIPTPTYSIYIPYVRFDNTPTSTPRPWPTAPPTLRPTPTVITDV